MPEPTHKASAREFRPHPPLVIGLLGGVAAGKSLVAECFAARGLAWIDADRKAREVVEVPSILARIAARFGSRVLGPEGRLDRQALAAEVFTDPGARKDLEAITHPAIRAAILHDLEAARAAGTSALLDVPLLLEGGLIERCDVCVFVEADEATRLARALGRGWSAEEFHRRERAQASLAEKKARAAYTIRNEGSRADTSRQVDEILARLASRPRDT
ncbi:MAG: dephospho-CoA kinase [Planctomycetes bacterium]|nr:dephospho-CoA kinase [Planctomycetota bacterium]